VLQSFRIPNQQTFWLALCR